MFRWIYGIYKVNPLSDYEVLVNINVIPTYIRVKV